MNYQKKCVAVLAGNMEQYKNFVKDKVDIDNYFYVLNRESCGGKRFSNYVSVGTFWRREDRAEIWEEVQSRLPVREIDFKS